MSTIRGTVLNGDFNFSPAEIVIDDGRFSDIRNIEIAEADEKKIIVPGLIDIHTHGAVGFDNSDNSPEAVPRLAEFMLKNGVTSYAPTLITGSEKSLTAAARNISSYIKSGEVFSRIAGIHLEGPYFSKLYKGAQNEKYLRNPDISEFHRINEVSGNIVKLISLAPELEGAIEFISAVKDSAAVSIGHTDSDYDTAMAAIAAGASHMTHTFNAMRPFGHRSPNALGAAFDSSITCECICDGIHVHPSAIRTLYKLVGQDRLVLISDSIRATGLSDGIYDLGGQEVTVKGKRATLTDGTIAGSTATLLGCVSCAVSFGIPIETAFKCASINPARVMRVDNEVGSIEIGKMADFLVLDEELKLCTVYKGGEQVFYN